MIPPVFLYFLGMGLLFVGQRILTEGPLSWGLSIAALVSLLAASLIWHRLQQGAEQDSQRALLQKIKRAAALGWLALFLYGLSTEAVVDLLGLTEGAAERWSVSFSALWPIFWTLSALPLLALEIARSGSPRGLPRRLPELLSARWVGGALVLCSLFPLNYLSHRHNQRWDLAYFKTTEVGSSTQALVSGLTDVLTVHVFQGSASEVTPELRAYFEQLPADKVKLKVVDHAASPLLSTELKIRGNGHIALTLQEQTKSWKVGADMDKARRNLKTLDEDFQKNLLQLMQGKQVVYVTTDHDEMSWKGKLDPDRKISGLKKLMEAQSYQVKDLGRTDGLGDAVPEDAAAVMVLAPQEPFLPAEIDSLKRFSEGGGPLLIAAEPGLDTLDPLLASLGLKLGEGQLATEVYYVKTSGGITDRANVATDRISSHASTSTLAASGGRASMVFFGSGWLEEASAPERKVTMVVRSLPQNWADVDGDLKLDESESKKIRPIVAAVEGTGASEGVRAMVVADATAFSDAYLALVGANQQFLWDGLLWLTGEEDRAGTVESEEDIKIQHTREGQVTWFYGTVLGFPLMVLALGWTRVRSRRRGGAA